MVLSIVADNADGVMFKGTMTKWPPTQKYGCSVEHLCRPQIFKTKHLTNKRARRALGRSPEEKVKGHNGAIYRGPLMLSTKYW